MLDVEVQSGKSHAAKHSLPRLRQLIEGLAPEKRPTLMRGDNAFGNEGVMAEMEEINQRYLFKLRQTDGIFTGSPGAIVPGPGRLREWF
ncbi:hypothetical protein [Nitrosomonas sp. Nm58]|uniref:hypothetical protein n=1 Tax=Nitrosomonas sp. Nm58 TaxID=200126 RepID=UPI00115F93E8|nr:hypothetical protein [Nitrosomonas sp. Nm58]